MVGNLLDLGVWGTQKKIEGMQFDSFNVGEEFQN